MRSPDPIKSRSTVSLLEKRKKSLHLPCEHTGRWANRSIHVQRSPGEYRVHPIDVLVHYGHDASLFKVPPISGELLGGFNRFDNPTLTSSTFKSHGFAGSSKHVAASQELVISSVMNPIPVKTRTSRFQAGIQQIEYLDDQAGGSGTRDRFMRFQIQERQPEKDQAKEKRTWILI